MSGGGGQGPYGPRPGWPPPVPQGPQGPPPPGAPQPLGYPRPVPYGPGPGPGYPPYGPGPGPGYPPYGPGPGPGYPPYGPPGRPPGRIRRAFRLLNPIAVGRMVFKPSRPDRVNDPAVRKVQTLRTVVGLAAVLWVLLSYRIVKDTGDLVDDRIDQIGMSMNLLVITFPIVVAVFIAVSRPPNRRLFLRRSLKPGGSLAALFAAVGGLIVLSTYFYDDFLPGDEPTPGAYARLTVMLFVLLWVFPFLFYGIAMALVHVFRTADIHESLPPILAIILVWELAITDLFSDAYDGVPFGVRAALILGGPVSITLISVWELRRLRSRHGITLRAALLR
ncbi:hypothetical protein SRB5_47130 [Streptomyces sp. RB5]|uniref:Uncharacterized protein n=1 Tax=Streptomyces smaragdinus TaxID=2585196 RepID=A0A7K0CM40_9ACTN|nr:hypothetical protein [Streptomyces smaragdinus]MQY14545.1 hypothetical protein [Streptomyces smaragdinus]